MIESVLSIKIAACSRVCEKCYYISHEPYFSPTNSVSQG